MLGVYTGRKTPTMKKIRPLWRRLIYCLSGLIILVFAGNIILNRVVENKIKQQLGALAPYADIRFSKAKINLFKFSLNMQHVQVIVYPDTTDKQHAHTATFTTIDATGINFFKALFSKKMGIYSVQLTGGNILLDSVMLYKKDLPHYNVLASMPFSTVDVSHINISTATVNMRSSSTTTRVLTGNIKVNDVQVGKGNAAMQYGNITADVQQVQFAIPGLQHTLQIQHVAFNSSSQQLQVDSLQMAVNKSAGKDTLPAQMQASIPSLTVTGLNIQQLQAGNVVVNDVSLDNSIIHVTTDGSLKKVMQPLTRYIQRVKTVKINTITVKDADIRALIDGNISSASPLPDSVLPQSVTIDNINLQSAKISLQIDGKMQCTVDELHITNMHTTGNKSIVFDDVTAKLSHISTTMPGSFNTIQVNKLAVNSKEQALEAEGIKIIPQYGKYALGNKLGHQADYIEGTIAGVAISGLHVKQLMQQKLQADNISVNKCTVYIFRDRRLPRLNNTQQLPVAFLKTLPVQLNVKKVQVKNAAVAYEEFPKDGRQTGTLKVVDMNMSIYPFTNNPAVAEGMHNHVEASIMGSGTVNADIFMPLSSDGEYYVNGAINNLSLTALNSSAENLGKFHIESGLLDNLSFRFWLNEERAHGKIVGEYHNLVLDKLKGNNKKKAAIPTFALKTIIIPKNKDKSLPERRRTGIIRYDHDPTRFFSFYLVKSLLSGVRDSFTFGFLLPK